MAKQEIFSPRRSGDTLGSWPGRPMREVQVQNKNGYIVWGTTHHHSPAAGVACRTGKEYTSGQSLARTDRSERGTERHGRRGGGWHGGAMEMDSSWLTVTR
jgi:hypothetical protein